MRFLLRLTLKPINFIISGVLITVLSDLAQEIDKNGQGLTSHVINNASPETLKSPEGRHLLTVYNGGVKGGIGLSTEIISVYIEQIKENRWGK